MRVDYRNGRGGGEESRWRQTGNDEGATTKGQRGTLLVNNTEKLTDNMDQGFLLLLLVLVAAACMTLPLFHSSECQRLSLHPCSQGDEGCHGPFRRVHLDGVEPRAFAPVQDLACHPIRQSRF